jgi:hypothetical protein
MTLLRCDAHIRGLEFASLVVAIFKHLKIFGLMPAKK